jgi:predicted alpha/beta-fold hydrolase
VLWRTCDGRAVNDVPRSYHSGASDDADEIIRRIAAENAQQPLFLLGVSLGGNVLLKWLGESGTSVPPSLRATAAVSVPFDLAAASRKLERGFSRIYSRFFLRSLRAKAVAKIERFPELGDRRDIESASTLWRFDDLVTAPLHGFRDAADYYSQSSSLKFLSAIRVPTLLLNSQDDPFLPREVLDRVREAAAPNPNLTCAFTEYGGHVGFISGAVPWRPRYWMESLALDWFSAHLKHSIETG